MKKIISLGICTLLFSVSALGQSRARVFDNFDTSKGVEVVKPTVTPIVKNEANNSRIRASKQTMSVEDGVGLKKVKYTSSSKLIMGTSSSMSGYTTGDPDVDSYIVDSSRRYNIDPLLIYSQMHQESAFKKKARSHKGASGLMQLMPATARRFGVTNIYDPQQNIDAGVKYMRWLLNKFDGDVVLALAGYNAGEGAVMKYGNNVPPYRETRNYVQRITARYNQISNPNYARSVKQVTEKEIAKIEKKEKKTPLSLYERNVTAVKLPDGRMRLVSQ
jgi:hypothetical protein